HGRARDARIPGCRNVQERCRSDGRCPRQSADVENSLNYHNRKRGTNMSRKSHGIVLAALIGASALIALASTLANARATAPADPVGAFTKLCADARRMSTASDTLL